MKSHSFCETPNENCTLSYCDENGCISRKRELVEEDDEIKFIKKQLENIEHYKMGYNAAQKTLYTKEDLIDLVQGLKDYTKESHTILGHDDREPSEFVNIFLNEISDEELESLSLAKELNKQPMTFVSDEISDKKRNFVFSDDKDINNKNITKISDKVLFEQATVAMEEIYGYGCDSEIDAYFRGAKWMQKQFKK